MKRTVDGKTEEVTRVAIEKDDPIDVWVAMKPVPKGEENPPSGEGGHRCLDPKGRYRPDWVSVFIERNQHTGAQQFFPSEDGGWRVKTSEWVDVPPEIVEGMRSCVFEYDEVSVGPNGEKISRHVRQPRFQFSSVPSA